MNIKAREKFRKIDGIIIKKIYVKFLYDVYVSNHGNIYKIIDGKRVDAVPVYDKSKGYMVVNLQTELGPKNILVHRLVALCFVPNDEPNHTIVNHIDGYKIHNYYKNLEWTDTRGNMQHASVHGLCNPKYGENHYISKLTESNVKDIKILIKSGFSNVDIVDIMHANGVDISRQSINQIRINKAWKHVSI